MPDKHLVLNCSCGHVGQIAVSDLMEVYGGDASVGVFITGRAVKQMQDKKHHQHANHLSWLQRNRTARL